MRHVEIYHSQTGFTAQYALWISQAAGADCLELSAAKRACLKEYDAIIFGSWVRAGTLCQSRWLKRNLETAWAGRKVLVFCVGGSPIGNPETQEFLEKLRAELKGAEVFYCPGGFRHERVLRRPLRADRQSGLIFVCYRSTPMECSCFFVSRCGRNFIKA